MINLLTRSTGLFITAIVGVCILVESATSQTGSGPDPREIAGPAIRTSTKSLPGVVGQTSRFQQPRQFLPYTRNLPRIDKIELLKLVLKDDRWNGEVAAGKVLQGAEAQKVASLWRRQTYTSSLSACHEPAYAIKFYYRERLIAYASVCWSCNSIYFITPNLHRTQSFAGGNERGEQLSEIFRLAFTASK